MSRPWLPEPLEPRRLFDIVLPVFGTGGDDFCTIEMDANFIYASMNGIMVPQPIGAFIGIEVHLGGGDDILEVRNTRDGISVLVGLGNGADTVRVASTSHDLDSIGVQVSVPSGLDPVGDNLFIFDDEDTGADTYDVTEEIFTDTRLVLAKGGVRKVAWEEDHISAGIFINNEDNTVNIDGVSLDGTGQLLTVGGDQPLGGSGGADTVNFDGTISGSNLFRFEAGPGDDRFNVNGDVLAGGSPFIEMVGNAGTDTFDVNDTAAATSYTFNSGGSFFDVAQSGGQGGRFAYFEIELLTVGNTHATQGTTFTVNGVASTTDLSINAGAGDDAFVLGDDFITTGDFGTGVDVSLLGGTGDDTLVIRDALQTAARTHVWGNDDYDTDALGVVHTSSITTATVNSGSGADVIDVNFNAGPGTLIINGNGGADAFEVTPDIVSRIELNGGAPTAAPGDTLALASAPAGGVFTAGGTGAGTYDFPQRDLVVFTGMENFPLPPTGAPGAPDLAAADDTGVSSTDNITNRTSLTFSGSGAPAGATVHLLRDGTQVATATATAAGAFTFAAVTFPAGDDTFAMRTAFSQPTTGLLGALSAAVNVRVDTLAPPTPGLPDMDAGSDTGISNTDNITRSPTPAFVGTVPANDIVRLLANNVLVGSDTGTSSGAYSVTPSALADGSYAVTVRFEDLAGNVSPTSSGLPVVIDTVEPAPPAAAPDLTAASDTGVSSTDNVTRDNTPTFTGAAPGNVVVRLRSGTTQVGFVQLPLAATTYNVTSGALADGNRAMSVFFEDLAGNQSAISPSLTVHIDTVAPTLVNQAFQFLADNSARFTFSEDLGAGIRVQNVSLKDVTNNVAIPNASLALSYTPNVATVTFPGFAGGILTDADWEMKLNADATDIAGNNFAGTTLDFFFLRGDANRDRRVNLADFNILAANFGQTNRNFSQGDFNYDNVVNLADFNLLAARFGASVVPVDQSPDDDVTSLID